MADPKILYVRDGEIREYRGEPLKDGPGLAWTAAPEGSKLADLWRRVGRECPEFTPEYTDAAIDEFLELFPGAEFGGGHIALSDGNLEDHHLASCIRSCLEGIGTAEDRDGREAAHFLACLMELDVAERMFPEHGCPCDDCGGCQCRWAGVADGCEDRPPCTCGRDADGFRV